MKIRDLQPKQSEASPEQSIAPPELIAAYNDFNERFDDRSDNEGYSTFWLDDSKLGPILQRNYDLSPQHRVILREPQIPSEVEDESDEPIPVDKPFLFELSVSRPDRTDRFPDWSVLVMTDGSYQVASRENYSAEVIFDAARKTFSDLT